MEIGEIDEMKKEGKIDKVKVGGFDGQKEEIEEIKEGEMKYKVMKKVEVLQEDEVKKEEKLIKKGKKGVENEKKILE